MTCKLETQYRRTPVNKGESGSNQHVWKACKRQKRFPGSNPGLSAKGERYSPFFY